MNEYSTDSTLLYHYTDWKGLCGILENQNLWATHNRFTNDASESLLYSKKVVEYLANSFKAKPLKGFSISDVEKLDVEKLVDGVLQKSFDGFYIASFCGEHRDDGNYTNENGLLSQWRAYGKDGGFALVFNKQGMEELISLEREQYVYVSLTGSHEVMYSNDEDAFKTKLYPRMKIIDDYFRAVASLNRRQEHSRGPQPAPSTKEVILAYLAGMCGYKHRGFKEENEFRIVANLPEKQFQLENPTLEKPYKNVKLRERDGEQVPYIELFESLEKALPIERIIVGPHRNKEARASAVMAMLQSHGRGGVEVTVSDIPYVGSK